MRLLFCLTALCLLVLSAALPAAAQDGPPPDSTNRTGAARDSLRRRPPDTTRAARQPKRPEAPSAPQQGVSQQQGLKAPVTFKARDSLVVHFEGKQKKARLYGESEATYQKSKLTAHQIDMLLGKNELQASGLPSDTGLVGRPHFKRGKEETFFGNHMAYNLQTERGRVATARTSFREGFVQGDVVKVMEDSTLYVANAAYTTCDCEDDPSYSLRSDRMKVKDKWVYSGPMRLFLFHIPTPLWLPFGFLPATAGRRSGPLPFDYGEDARGFFLRNIGWYQILNKYTDARLTGGYWTSGSWQVRSRFRYKKRYDYDGDLSLDYQQVKSGEATDRNYSESGTIRFGWNHNQEFNPNTSLRSRVDLTSASHLRTSENLNDQIRQQIGSRISFKKQWPSLERSFSISADQNQYLRSGRVDLTLPDVSFRQSSRKPLQREDHPPGEDERWYEKITYRYSGSVRNGFQYPSRTQRLSNGVDSTDLDIPWYEALVSPSTYRKATGEVNPYDFRAEHSVPVSASFNIRRFFGQPLFLSLTPNFNYEEDWRLYRRELRPQATSAPDAPNAPPQADSLAFQSTTHFTAIRQFNTGLSASTRFYGTFPLRVGPLEGLRHTVRPSLSFSYRPDFRSPFWGYTDTFRDSTYTIVERRFLNGPQKTLSLNVTNVFETKHVSTDSTGKRHEETLQLLNLRGSMSYNASSERRPLSNLRLSARLPFLKRGDVSLDATLSPYALDGDQHETDRFVWQERRLPRLDRFSLRASTSLGPGDTRRSSYGAGRSGYGSYGNAAGGGYGNGGYAGSGFSDRADEQPVDFSIPWALSLNFNYDLTRRSDELEPTATLNSRFTFSPTPKWQVRGSSGYSLENMEFSTTRLDISRDLGCWEMSINWVPFGQFQRYGFTLQVKSGKLRNLLKLSHPRSDIKSRFGGLVN